ncbi:hypothetical protein Dsin_009144 [Dipteronia sinensis]|uniref:Reverse transcriptase zinc-binding domain-containing protein n=1 Tax=Dipteronia sinensis TaxID=43782 RepID=A0AAE0AR99_9ROSI|nr:hypothetical protein Dsin_009144 [Dipteronia sinensis]
MGLHFIGSNARGTPSMWIFGSTAFQDATIVLSHSQYVTVSANFCGIVHRISFIYASVNYITCRSLWSSLMDIAGSDVPWLVLGDFNSVLGAHDTTGNVSTISCDDFRAALTVCDLVDIEIKGFFHTRISCGRHGMVLSRLDRAVCSHSFLAAWSHIACVILPRSHLDHHPLLISYSAGVSSSPRPFRFQGMWVSHPSFLNLVRSVWSFSIARSGSGIVVQKLKLLKKALRRWNWEVFGDIALNVSNANEKVMLIQGMIGSEGFLDDLFRLETSTLADLDSVLKQHEIFLKEKSRVRWLAEGDRNSKFFHSLLKRRGGNKALSSIQIGENISYDPTEIEHVPSLVAVDDNASILQVPSFDEVRSTIFAMDPLSAPGPDGFLGSFYSHCWEIVGHDVVLAVQVFFHTGRVFPGLNSNFLVLIPKTRMLSWLISFARLLLNLQVILDAFALYGSLSGRLCLIDSVVMGSFLYSIQFYRWPLSLLKDLNAVIRNFFWTGSIDGRKSIQVAWKSCCRTNDSGVLGVKDLGLLNKAMLKKFTWRMLTAESFVFTYLRACFFTQDHRPRTWYVVYSVWPGLKLHYTPLMSKSRWLVGRHSKVYFWTDNWLGDPLIGLVEDMCLLQPPLDSIVCDIYSDSTGWDIPESFRACHPDVASEIEKVVGKQIWASFIPPFRFVLIWHLFHGKIPTDIALRARGYISPSRCRFCCAAEEDLRHLFLDCPFVRALWDAISSTFGHRLKLDGTCLDLWQEEMRVVFSTKLKALWRVSIITIFWVVWFLRNQVTFEGGKVVFTDALSLNWRSVREADSLQSGTMKNSVDELLTLHRLHVSGVLLKVDLLFLLVSVLLLRMNWQLPFTLLIMLGLLAVVGYG